MAASYTPWAWTLAVLLLWQPAQTGADNCTMTSPCFFDCGHTVLDMTALKNYVFQNVVDSKGLDIFSYGPCATFTQGIFCVNTHVCRTTEVTRLHQDVGKTLSWALTPGSASYLNYTHTPIIGATRRTRVSLQCGPPNMVHDPSLKVHGQDPKDANLYVMTLVSHHACLQNKSVTTTPATNVTTHNTTPSSHNVTTEPRNLTTHVTTPSSHNVTTQPHNVTTHVTTPSSHNVTTVPRNLTTHVTTPSSHNVTTEPRNVTTHVTTPSSHNVTTEPHNVTTHVTTPAGKNGTTVHVITTGSSHKTTHGHVTTTPAGGANDMAGWGVGKTMVVMLMATVAALASF